MPLSAPTRGRAHATNTPPQYKPTGEQQDIIDAAHSGGTVVAEALAGTGKTSTLVHTAHSFPRRPGTYLAFNKSVQIEAESRFPDWIDCRTAHSVAYEAVGRPYRDRLQSRRISANEMSRRLKSKPAFLDEMTINPVNLVRMAQATVSTYMKTADQEIGSAHIPARVLGLFGVDQIAPHVLPLADKIWEDLRNPKGVFHFTHDVYLKLWQLTNPRIPSDYIMFDEAQDADPVTAAIVAAQDAQKMYVGDRHQAIYGWRGAVDAMSKVDGVRLPLRQSFRFGDAVADLANEWLAAMGSRHRLVGNPKLQSVIGDALIPRAILCRTNGTALGWVIAFHERGMPVALAPGDKSAGKDIERFAWAAKDLMNGEGTDHPDLVGFQTWKQLVDFVDEEENTADLKRMVNIINRIGVSGVIDAIRKLVPEEKAQITVSTAHKAKGLEWSSVKVADDFVPPDPEIDDEPDPADAMLAYVTVTRAKELLDPGALATPSAWGL